MKYVLTPHNRHRIHAEITQAPDGWIVDIREPTRSLQANAAMWAALSDVADQVVWYGRKLTAEEFKHVFTAALSKQDVVPGIDGGFVVLGLSTSKMTIREMSDLIEIIHAFGAENGVRFSAPEREAA